MAARLTSWHTTPPPPFSSPLLLSLSLSFLSSSLETALFYAERLYALDTTLEPSVYLLATILARLGHPHRSLHLLRQTVAFDASSHSGAGASGNATGNGKKDTEDLFGGTGGGTNNHRLVRPAIECSVRCARLYGQVCTSLGRDKEGRQALFRITQPWNSLAPTSSDPLEPSPTPTVQIEEATIIDLEMARLARKGGEHERAVQSYAKVLSKLPSCWEALETLCQLGAPPADLESLYPLRSRPSAAVPHAQPPTLQPAPNPATRSHPPPPLGPSLNSTINAPHFSSFGRPRNGDMQETPLGFSTPADPGQIGFNKYHHGAPAAGGGFKGKGKESWLIGGGGGGGGGMLPRRTATGRYGDITETSIDDQSFDTSVYPSAPLFSNPLQTQNLRSTALPPASSLFTPPTTSTLPTATAPGVKRTRGGNVAPSSTTLAATNEEEGGVAGGRGKRLVRGVPGESKARRGAAVVEPPTTRRSSRLSRDAGSSTGAGSAGMMVSRSQSSLNGSNAAGTKNAATRDKKRSKANAGPSVLSDAGSEPRSPPSHSSSPAPSSPGGTSHSLTTLPESARLEAEDYIASILRGFGHAAVAQSRYENSKAVEALGNLPIEQQRSARCLVMLGRAHFESLNYEKAEKAFAQARSICPHLLDSMDLFSTTLWHRRLSTPLSLLSQELMLLSSTHPSSWIATGNTFSLNSDHASALKCFKRAVQIDQNCVYAYTLAGHECVVLEEWERATGFFREAIRRDGLHYNAWFGLGNVYMKTGKITLADYHFRRALEINPSNATLVCCVGSVLEKSRRYKEALETYERACLLAPESSLARFRKVRMMVALGKHQLAEPELLQLKSLAPLEPTVHYLLGKLYKSLGPSKRTQMLAAFTTAQDLEPRMASVIREQIERSPEGMEVDDSEADSIA